MVHSEMAFEWDQNKAAANMRKHGVRFAHAIAALEDERAMTVRRATVRERRRYEEGL